ncbi:hemolysin family protein [Acidimicrobiia bacterium EGI L10123]|uniref:hemolysin family protein n=1 Tax=Salinilacustrithrix flava TaxID=2957203 RepID=UPI003D7C16EC|nr:hemolysin family protein [Acidimicrobiia bacterium EGI L10123]
MRDVLPELGLVGVLVLLNAAFAGTELALVSLREGQLQRLERQSSTGAVLADLARDPNRFLATIQIGITLAGFLASAAAAVSLAEPLEEPLGFLGGAAEPVAVVVVTLVLAYVTLVFGELAPKRVAMQRAERWGMVTARPLAFISVLTRPIVWLLSHSTDVAVRLMGGDPHQDREEITEEELRDMVAVQTSFTPKQRLIIDGAFEIAERTLEEVLRPRGEVFVLDAEQPGAEALEALAASGHSRAPVGANGNLDEVIGVVHLRDLLGLGNRPVADAASEIRAFPETAGVLDALHQMQQSHAQLAVVVDEHGSGAGIVTVEDLVEELVGEIYDETDRDVLSVQRHDDGSLVLPGQFPVHDLTDIGIDGVEDGPYTTVAGLILDRLGRVPEEPGDRVLLDGWELVVDTVHRHAITQVRAIPRGSDDVTADPSEERR